MTTPTIEKLKEETRHYTSFETADKLKELMIRQHQHKETAEEIFKEIDKIDKKYADEFILIDIEDFEELKKRLK